MVFRVILASLVAAVVLMAWGTFVWMMSGVPFLVLKGIPDEDAVMQVLKEKIPAPGDYIYPFMGAMKDTKAEQEAAMENCMGKFQAGPLVGISYHPGGIDPMAASTYIAGFAHNFGSALLVGGLLAMAAPGLMKWRSRVLFVWLVGLFASVSISLADPIWFHRPWNYPLFSAGFHWGGWLVAAPVMALIVKQAKSPPALAE